MKYVYNEKTYNIPDAEIDKAMEKLDCSIADACEMYLADHDLIVDETEAELTAKATKNRITATIHDAKGEKKPRKPREKKVNELKKQIIAYIFEKMYEKYSKIGDISIKNDEKYIDFTIENRDFTLNLVEHRKKKE